MTKLEEKLIELGYKCYVLQNNWIKQSISIVIDNKGKYIERYYVALKQFFIHNEDDLEAIKNDINYYHKQLKRMQKDLEVLKNV